VFGFPMGAECWASGPAPNGGVPKGEIQPVKWELEERKKKKTDKLRKAIARDEKLI
jgi:hypothetical protein